jgi:hypothetical protein
MTPPSMESIFLILSGVILAAGILYWLWSHIQLTQKKVQLLENAVFELRGRMMPTDAGPPVVAPAAAAPAPAASAYEDLADDDWEAPTEGEVAAVSTPLEALGGGAASSRVEIIREDVEAEQMPEASMGEIQPGGRIVSAAEVEAVEEKSAEEFRELFLSENAGPRTPAGSSAQPLESMPVKELRRLAEQRGITGVAELRKKELLAALRQQVSGGGTVAATLDLTVEHADATEVEAEALVLE